MSRLTRKVISIPADRAADDDGREAAAVIKRFRFLHRFILPPPARQPDRARHRTMTLTADEFIRRFLLHVLPGGFMRIRSYGWLANCHRCSASSRPSLHYLPPAGTTVTVTSGSPAGHCATAPCAARAIWSASKAACLASCRGLRLTPAMCTNRHHHQPEHVGLPPMRPTRTHSCSGVVAPSQCRKNSALPHPWPSHSHCLRATGSLRPLASGLRWPRAGYRKSPRHSFTAHRSDRLRSGLAQTFF
jgi:Putative transposase